MIEGEFLKPVFYALMATLTILDLFVHIDQLFMVFIFTGFLVYIGAINSAKIFTPKASKDIESMKQKDAWLFPVFGSCVLFGLFIVFKYLNKSYVNILFHCYFTLIGAYSIALLIYEKICELPFFKPYTEKIVFTIPKIPYVNDKEGPFNQGDLLCFIPGGMFGLCYFFFKNWILNNILGCAFSIFGIENMMLGQYKIGLILLVLLFFYDIFWVFFTEVMVSVAKNLDGPIKLMFPKVVNYSDQLKDFNGIGGGDIVIPGIYVALMLRFDIVRYIRKTGGTKGLKMNFANFKYFLVTLGGYVLGIFVTGSIMIVFQHAQPAGGYGVPGTLITSTVTAVISGDMKELWEFNEEKVQEELKLKETADDKKAS